MNPFLEHFGLPVSRSWLIILVGSAKEQLVDLIFKKIRAFYNFWLTSEVLERIRYLPLERPEVTEPDRFDIPGKKR
jgi:hypothetical protein